MPPPPLKWQPVQFIWPNSSLPAAMAGLLPSNRVPIRSNGGGEPPLGKRPVTAISLGPCCASGAAACCADASLLATASIVTRAKGKSRVAAGCHSGFRQGEDIERPSGCGFRLEIRHDAVHAKCAGRIQRIKVPGDDGACPAAAPRRQVLLDGPDRLVLYRIPGGELAAIATGAGLADDLGADERCASDVADGPALPIHAQVLMRYVHQAGRRRKRRRIPVLESGRRRADVVYDSTDLGELVRVHDGPPGLKIDAENGIDVAVWLGRDDLATLAVHHIEMTVAVRMQQYLARVAAHSHVDQDLLVDPVVVVLVVRVILQRPFGGAGIGIACEQRRGPFVVAWTLLLVPRARIAGAVIDQVQVGIVGDPSPHRSSSGLPGVGRPGLDAEIGAVIRRIERAESGADQYVLVRPRGVGSP